MIPRTKREQIIEVVTKVKRQEISIQFSREQIREALLEKYHNEPVGPEGYKLNQNAEVRFDGEDYEEQIIGVELVWYEDE